MRCITVVALVAAVGTAGCSHRLERTLVEPTQAAQLDHDSPLLKAHMRNGEVYVLGRWQVTATEVIGDGQRYDLDRELIGEGPQRIAIAEVALFETNVKKVAPQIAGIVVVTLVSAAVTVACAVNPKACFGSCPTFYVEDGGRDTIEAEGFSASIAPALEATDVDALWGARPAGRRVVLRVTNEALETHVIRRVELLAAERPPGTRVVADGTGRPWQVSGLRPPAACRADEGDCLPAVTAWDDRERWSRSDGVDLAAREHVEIDFAAAAAGEQALVIGFRQTLLSTFLLYQGLAFLGREATATLARLERGDASLLEQARGLPRLLGGIEVQALGGDGAWRTVGELDETGPIASDVQLVRLPAGTDARRLRLRLTRGHWRLGMLALARIDGPARVTRLAPAELRTGGRANPAALRGLRGADPLITLPGDQHALIYQLPDDPERIELLLSSRGYYLEWMRQEWLADEDPLAAALLLKAPAVALRWLAPRFQAMEPRMEELFWRSRYAPR